MYTTCTYRLDIFFKKDCLCAFLEPPNSLTTIFLYTPWFPLYCILYQIVVYCFRYSFTLAECAPKQHDAFEPDSDGNMPDIVFYDVPFPWCCLRYSHVDKHAYISMILWALTGHIPLNKYGTLHLSGLLLMEIYINIIKKTVITFLLVSKSVFQSLARVCWVP